MTTRQQMLAEAEELERVAAMHDRHAESRLEMALRYRGGSSGYMSGLRLSEESEQKAKAARDEADQLRARARALTTTRKGI